MKGRGVRTLTWGAAVAAVLIGLSMAGQSLLSLKPTTARLQRRLADLRQLRAMQATLAGHHNAIEAFEKIGAAYPVPLSGLVQTVLPDEAAEVRPHDPAPLIPGWTLNRAEVVFQSVRLERAAELIAKAESQRPPWRVAECVITSIREGDGRGQVKLVLESIEKAK